MTRCWAAAASCLVALVGAAVAAPAQEAQRTAAPTNFAAALAAPVPSHEVLSVAMEAPLNLLPMEAGPVTGDPAAAHPRVARQPRVPPVPRLRPAYAPALQAGSQAAPAAPQVIATKIDETVTGSIGEAPTDAAFPQSSVAVPAAGTTPPPSAVHATAVAPRSDGLLGDPAEYLMDEPPSLTPKVPVPTTVSPPKGMASPAAGDDGAAMAAGPLMGTAPFELVRTLQSLQDRMAEGDVQAIAAQRVLMVQIDRAFMAADPVVWQDNRNAAAAVTYVLSGGSPEILKKLAALEPPPAIAKQLLDGVLDYASGRADAATPLLVDIDPTGLPASMGGQLAIAESALAVRNNPARAMQLLSLARLLAPGTLVEEAAIRRQLLVADRLHDENAVRSLARQYLDRFRHSVYAGNFRIRFAAALSHMASLDSEDHFPELDDMLAMVEPQSRCDLYLTIALASAVSGQATAARLAAERASGLALAGSEQEARAKLYHAAALATMPTLADKGAAELASIDRKLLSSSDLALADVVGTTLAGVRAGTELDKIKVAVAKPLGAGALVEQPPIIKKAQAALDDTAKLVATAQ
jgi:chemotaxis protein MotC